MRAIGRRNYRYRFARWGYNTSVLAWEVWNEHGNIDPGTDVANFYTAFGSWAHTTDAHKHLFTTSMGSQTFTASFWATNNVDVPNYHDYITTALQRHPVAEESDESYFVFHEAQLCTQAWQSGTDYKPWIWGEIGTLTTWNNDDPVATTGTGGQISRHGFLWGGMFCSMFVDPIDWQTVSKYSHTAPCRAYFNGEPYSTANWALYATSESNPPSGYTISCTQSKLRVLGLVSASGNRFLGWCHNTDNTWGNVARDGHTPSPITGSFTTPSLNAGDYRIEWWDTYAGSISSQSNVNGWGGGGMTLTLPASITTDCAVKIINTGGGGGDTTPGHDEQPGHVQPDDQQHHADLDGPRR